MLPLLVKLLIASPSVHDVRFDVSDLAPVDQPALRQERSWSTPTLDSIVLQRLDGSAQSYFARPPERVEEQLKLKAQQRGYELERFESASVADAPAYRALFRIPHQGEDASYAASLAFAMEGRVFEFTIVAPDHDVTGLRGVLVTQQLLEWGHRPERAEDGSYTFPAWDSPEGIALAALVDDPRGRLLHTLTQLEGSLVLGQRRGG